MIPAPKRSVTRFFVPLIDVLSLLFTIFLLLPFVARPAGAPDPTADPGADSPDLTELQLRAEQLRQENEALRRSQADPGERLSVRVLDIDPATGKLYSFDPDAADPRQEVRDAADAQRLIAQQRRRAGGKEPFFLVLYPRQLTGFPLQSQVDAYRRWFAGVPLTFDNPWRPAR
jgi:hypothetical protein